MRTRRRRVAAAAFIAALAALSLAAPSALAGGLTTGFADPSFVSPQRSERTTWLDQAVNEDAGIVRLGVNWANTAGSSPPANPTNPADPDYDFSRVDNAVRDARARGLRVLLTIQVAPTWAEGSNRPRKAAPGTWKPNPRDFGEFAQAVAKRYSGTFRGLPRVRFFQAWNEQNLSEWLTPQWHGKKPASPNRYRKMLNAFYSGVKQAQPKAKVVSGGVAPTGDPPGGARMRPVTFLRNLFCINKGGKTKGCNGGVHVNVLADHPITSPRSGGPTTHARNGGDIFVADFHKVRSILRAAERAKTIRPARHHQLWATEFWWLTNPPRGTFPFGVSPKIQARWIEETLYLLWKQGARVAINFPLHDGSSPGSLAAGTFFHTGKKKPSFRSFRFPFVTYRNGGHEVRAWAKAPAKGKLEIQRRRKGRWRTMKTLRVHRGQVFTSRVHVHGIALLRGKVGGITSLPWTVGR